MSNVSPLVRRLVGTTAVAVAVASGFAMPTSAKMQSTKISKNVCETTGGGRFVNIPGFPGEKIDRRLLKDIKFLRRKYNIFITDGHSTSSVHSANGEHPIGLALDIVPNFSAGGDWNDIDRLAKFAEPTQNQPRSPFRWVGYNGDANHGRGHHLHLSYAHSPSSFNKPADTVYSLRCPKKKRRNSEEPKPEPQVQNHQMSGGSKDGSSGGVTNTGGGGGGGSKGGSGGGGVSTRTTSPSGLAPVAPESGGVDG